MAAQESANDMTVRRGMKGSPAKRRDGCWQQLLPWAGEGFIARWVTWRGIGVLAEL